MSAVQPSLAVICNSVPPYRVHVHQRIVRELPWLKLFTACTHDGQFRPWTHRPPAEINPVDFGTPDDRRRQGFNLASFRKGGQIIRWLKRQQITAVLVLGYNDSGRLRIFRWCAANGVPCFVWGDSNIKADFASGWRRTFKKIVVGGVIRRVSAVLACGTLGAAFFERYGARPSDIFFFPNEPDYAELTQITEEQVAAALSRFSLNPSRRRLVYSGRLVTEKRIDLLIDVFCRIADRRPRWDLLIIGDGPLRDELRRAVPAAVESRIIWTGFIDDQATIAALYHGSDVLALPSEYEPWALVINEAVAAGMAIVSTDVAGAAAELVREGVNGYVVPPGDVEAWTTALLNATDAGRIDALKRGSTEVLSAWRRRADPVEGLRRALAKSGIGPPNSSPVA